MNFFKKMNGFDFHGLKILSYFLAAMMIFMLSPLVTDTFWEGVNFAEISVLDLMSKMASYVANILSLPIFIWLIATHLVQAKMLSDQAEDSKAMLKIVQKQFEVQQANSEEDRLRQFLSVQPNFINVETRRHLDEKNNMNCCKVEFVNVGVEASEIRIEDEYGYCISEWVGIIKRGESASIKTQLPFFSEDLTLEKIDRDGLDTEKDYYSYRAHILKCWISYNDLLGLRQRAYLHLHYTPFPVDGKRVIRASIDMQEKPHQYTPTPLKDDESVVVEDVH